MDPCGIPLETGSLWSRTKMAGGPQKFISLALHIYRVIQLLEKDLIDHMRTIIAATAFLKI